MYAEKGKVLVFAQKCNTKSGCINIELAKKLSDSSISKYPDEEYLLNNDIIVNSTGIGTLGRVGLYTTNDNPLSIPIVSDSHITVVRVYNLISLFIYYVLKWYQPLLEKYGDGSTKQKELKAEKIKSLYIPLPPLAEQYRIVAKIEELLPYIESYKQAETQIAALNSTFPELLKKSMLQEAVMGKLVPQNPYDEPASVLLDRIRAEKQELIKQGKIKSDKHESVIFKRDNSHYERIGDIERCIDDELPFEIPESWEWCRLNCIVSKEIKRGKAPKYDDGGKNLVFAQKCNVKSGGINLSLAKNLSDAAFSKYPVEEYLIDGDIVVNSTGNGTLGRIGIFRDYDRINDSTVVPDSHVTVIRIIKSIRFKYLYYTLKWYQPYLEKTCEGSTNQTELKPAIISSLLIPVPPLSEQIRIIHQIENLMNLTSQL